MEVIFILLPAALLFAVVAVAVFCWATHSGQFDDLETPALRMLGDDQPRGAEQLADEVATAAGGEKT